VAPRARVSIRDLSKTFGQGPREVPAVSPVSFDVHEREFVAIVGPSGCGKSTILNMIGGLVAPSGGEIVVDGLRVTGAPPPQVGYVFQKDTVFPWRTVERNIALGLEYRHVAPAARATRVREAIALAGLQGFEDAFPATLSGGMRQRVALMRSLVVDPEILLTVIFVTHDLSEAITLADRIVVMTRRPGRIKLIYDVNLPRPRDVIRVRETAEYSREYGEIWHALGEEFRPVVT
jgi:NitT/TauT family transport system ATP-binding protein